MGDKDTSKVQEGVFCIYALFTDLLFTWNVMLLIDVNVIFVYIIFDIYLYIQDYFFKYYFQVCLDINVFLHHFYNKKLFK